MSAPDLLEALQYAVKQVPELATVPGIANAIAKATGAPMNITNNRLPAPAELPGVQPSYEMSKEFFRGWWAGLVIGFVIGAGVIVVVLP